MKCVPCQFFQRRRMFPAFPQPAVTQGHQGADGQHERIALRLGRWFVDERTDTSIILFMNKVSMSRSTLVDGRICDSLHQIFLDVVEARR